ncbi:hypothetical protein FNH22_05635 [Fulvivirga sp. M361]|uniref:phage holin family protein n=1 Tax=Fulvivirga sp. M361 TaxID=2594266 RepID=UPI001179944D|nr:phage holin family protein [Fulvivirga sp. M361]TRX60531.1 hypothetical protein FNH22_05635 [Fulvivirga sp. M361]
MNWIKPLVRTLAWAALPVKIIDKGLDHAKSELKEEIKHYEVRLKLLTIIGSSFLFFLLFASVLSAFLIGNWVGSLTNGFAVVTGIYFLVFLSLIFVYKNDLLH